MSVAIRWALRLALASSVTFSVWTAAGDARNTAQQLRVAIVIPKAGSFKVHNRLIANGATIAAQEIGAGVADKGHSSVALKLSVVSVRPTISPTRVVRSLARRSTRALILPCDVELQESLARAAAKAGLLTLSPCNPDARIAKSLPRYWPTGATGSAEAGQLVYYAKYRQAKTAFLVGAAGSWYARLMTGELRKWAKRDGINIVGEASLSGGAHGLTSLAKRIRKLNPAIVFAAVPSPGIESIITELRQKRVLSAFLVTDGMDAALDLARYRTGPANSSLEQVVFATFGFPRTTSGRFVNDYEAAFRKKIVGSFPGLGYETVQVLEAAARRASALTPAGLNASFAKGFTVKGVVLEDTRYQGHGHRQPVTNVGLAEVVRDQYVPLFVSVAGHPTG